MKRIALSASALALAAFSNQANASVVISSDTTSHMTCSAGACTPTAKNAVLNVSQLQGLLASGDVTVNTGSGAVTIAVSSPLTWTSTSRLTLNASQGVAIKAAVVVEGTGAITIAATGGALNFYPGGSISFWDNTSSLIIGGNSYTLIGDYATLVSDISSNPSGYYAFAKDPEPVASQSQGIVLTPFGGTFEGLGHTMNRIVIDALSATANGVFAQTEPGSVVRDLNLTRMSMSCSGDSANSGLLVGLAGGEIDNVTVVGTMNCLGTNIGGLVGQLQSGGTLSHASAQVKVGGHFLVGGGLVGMNSGSIDNSSASGRIGGGHNAQSGGLVGVSNGMITDSHATGDVLAGLAQVSGGLLGTMSGGQIERCYATGTVTARNIAGGLVGKSNSAVDSSFATGAVHAVRYAGGVIGEAGGGTTIYEDYSTGAVTVTGGGATGGLAAVFSGVTFVKDSWSSSAVSGSMANVGGFVGRTTAHVPITSAYWDLDTSGVSNPSQGAGGRADYPGITGLTTAQFQSALPAGFNPSDWAQSPSINNGYPYLIANPPQ